MTTPSRRDQRVFVLGWGISVAGDYFALIALILAAHDATQSSWAVAGVMLAVITPAMVLAGKVGALVDRRHPAQVMVALAIGQAVLIAALAAFATNLVAIYALALVSGIGVAVARPAVFVFTPQLFPPHEDEAKDQLTKGNTRVQFGRSLGVAAGEAAGGIAVAAIGVKAALLLDAASFLLLAVLYLPLLRVGGPATEATASDGDAAGPPTPDRWSNPVLLIAVAVVAAITFFGGIIQIADVFLAKDVLGAGDAGFGLLHASWTLGIVVGLAFLAARLPKRYLLQGLLVAGAVTGAVSVVAGLAPTIAVAMGAYVLGGAANGVGMVAVQTLFHTQVHPSHHGRAYSGLWAALSTAEVAAMFAGGLMVGLAGARGSIVINGLGILAVVALAAVVVALRRPLRPANAPPG